MSLDVYLISPIKAEVDCSECGKQREIDIQLYQDNITHNLSTMAEKAGIYKHLWRPEELGITTAKQLIQPLTNALVHLNDKPKYFQKFNPPNKWGAYENLVVFVMRYLEACKDHPDAIIEVDR